MPELIIIRAERVVLLRLGVAIPTAQNARGLHFLIPKIEGVAIKNSVIDENVDFGAPTSYV